ncbi:MAG: hypothetical protein M4579_005796 [Chaenotheca gracillima]|nr:MAG: hypothetical protein M4579_005796 [Chaenotheca gracillima]
MQTVEKEKPFIPQGYGDEKDVELAGEKGSLSRDRMRGGEHVINVACVLVNTVCTIALVFANKIVFDDPQLGMMPMSFAMWHFSCTAIVMWIASHKPFHLFEPVRLPGLRMIPLCAFFIGFLILNNRSLAVNSIGFYQLAKIMTTPTVVLLNYLFFSKTIKSSKVTSLVCICCGVGFVTGSTIGANIYGVAVAGAAFTITALYQVWIGKKILDFKVSAPQLLMNQAPISALLLAALVPFFDTTADFRSVPLRPLLAFLLSGLVASLLNLSQFLIIGRMSALTFNVTSNLKTVLIISFGWIQEGKVLLPLDMIGVMLAIGGVAYYTHLSRI